MRLTTLLLLLLGVSVGAASGSDTAGDEPGR